MSLLSIPDDASTTDATGDYVSKWMDNSEKHGLGYQLSDGVVGLHFNDYTSIIMHKDQQYARGANCNMGITCKLQYGDNMQTAM